MKKITSFEKMDAPDSSGTSLKEKLSYGITYNDLVNYLGQPTLLPSDSGDGKVMYEWIVEYETEENGIQLFTIYDWKSESPEFARNEVGSFEEAKSVFGSRWHIGGKEYAGDFVEYLESEIKKLEIKLPF